MQGDTGQDGSLPFKTTMAIFSKPLTLSKPLKQTKPIFGLQTEQDPARLMDKICVDKIAQYFPFISSNDTNSDISRIVNKILRAPGEALRYIIDIKRSIQRVIQNIVNTIQNVYGTVRHYGSFLLDIKAVITNVVLGIIGLLCLYVGGMTGTIISVVTMVYTLFLDDSFMTKWFAIIPIGLLTTQCRTQQPNATISTNIHVAVNSKEELEDKVAQGSLDLTMKTICFCFAIMASVFVPFDRAWQDFINKCDKLPKAVNGISAMMNMFDQLFQPTVSGYIQELTGWRTEELSPIPADVEENRKKVLRMSELNTISQLGSNSGLCIQIQQIYHDFMNLRMLYYNNRTIMSYLDTYQGAVVDLFKKAAAANPRSNSERSKPTCVLFKGTTGVGKSSLMYFVTADILKHYGLLENKTPDEILHLVNSSIYARNGKQEFFDAYLNQLVTVVDDFGCMKDGPTHPSSDYEELLRMVNNFPYPLPMASLAQKANTYFTSRFVFLTSNLDNINPTSMINPEALRSRISFTYNIRIKDEYKRVPGATEGELAGIDVKKVRQKFGHKQTTEIYIIDRFDIVTGAKIGECTYEEMIRDIVAHHDSEEQFFANKQESILDHLTRHAQDQPVVPSHMFEKRYGYINIIGDSITYYAIKKDAVDNIVNRVRSKIPDIDEHVVRDFFEDLKYVSLDHATDCAHIKDALNGHCTLVPACHILVNIYLREHAEMFKMLYDETRVTGWNIFDRFNVPYGKAYCNVIRKYVEIGFKRFESFYSGITSRTDVSLMLTLLGIIASVIGLWSISNWFRRETETEKNSESGMSKKDTRSKIVESGMSKKDVRSKVIESGVSKKDRVSKLVESGKIKNVHLDRIMENEDVDKTAEAFTSLQANEACKIIMPNCRVLRDPITLREIAKIFIVRGWWTIMNYHTYYKLTQIYEPSDELLITAPGHENGTIIPFSCLLEGQRVNRGSQTTDLFLFKLPRTCNQGRDMLKHFHTRSAMNDLAEKTTVLLLSGGADGFVKHTGKLLKKNTVATCLIIKNGEETRDIITCMTYDCDIRTDFGDCGSVYMADTDLIKGKIIGFHFAGTSNGGSSAIPLIYEDFEHLCDEPCIEYPDNVKVGQLTDSLTLNGIIPVGQAQPPHMATKTKLVKTDIFGKVDESNMLPAKLGRLLEEGGAGLKGLQKVVPTIPYIDKDEIEMARSSYEAVMWRGEPSIRRVLTIQEAIDGQTPEETQHIKGINRSTSAGYPHMLTLTDGKKKLFGYNEYVVSEQGQQVLDNVQNIIERVKTKKEYVQSIYVDTLKDETRTIEKVNAGKTRVFAAASVEYIILFRMYFLAFLNYIMENRISNEVSVGVCAQSTEWNKLALYLRYQGDNIVAGDFSNYDGTLNANILYVILDIINDWYDDGEENRLVRSMLFEDIVHSLHIAEDNVYSWTHSLPSGNPGTAVLNSIYNALACRIIYNRIMKNTKYYGRFNKYVRMNAYGDDNLLSINREIIDSFNQISMTEAFKTIGMTYTDETKSAVLLPYKSLRDCSYLKRQFRFDDRYAIWFGPLDRRSINERLNWNMKNPNPDEILLQNAEGAIAEWALHDEETFKFWSKKIQIVIKEEKGMFITVYNQAYYLDYIMSGKYSDLFPQLQFQGSLWLPSSSIIGRKNKKIGFENLNGVPIQGRVCHGQSPIHSPSKGSGRNESSSTGNSRLATTDNNNIKNNMITERKDEFNNSETMDNNEGNPTLIGQPQTTTSDTTRFTNEGHINEQILNVGTVAHDHFNIVSDHRRHTIESFLSRPHKIASFKWSSQVQGKLLHRVSIMETLEKMASEMKLTGFYGFTANAKMRIVANAQPFHTGMLQIAYRPIDEVASVEQNNYNAGFYFKGGSDMVHLRYESGCPHVTLNLGSTSQAEMEVAYIGDHSILSVTVANDWKRRNLRKDLYDPFGAFYIRVLSSLKDSTNTPSIMVNVYMSFTNVRTYGTSMIPWFDENSITNLDDNAMNGRDPELKVAQGISDTLGKVGKAISQTQEAKQMKDGSISSIANTVGSIAGKLTAIPGVADIAGPVSWISKGVGAVANMFGFSKPHSTEPTQPRWINPFKDFAHCDGQDHSTKLTVNPSQEIQVKPIGPTDKDEMTLAYILQRPTYLDKFTWKPSDDEWTLLKVIDIAPEQMCMHEKFKDTAFDLLTSHTYLSYLATMFQYWMGTIRVTFTIVGNKFYSGRLRLIYIPDDLPNMAKHSNSSTNWGLAPEKRKEYVNSLQQHQYYHIVDIRDANTFSIDCGFIDAKPWKTTRTGEQSLFNRLYVYVETPLAKSDTVSDDLDVLIHVSACEDFAFAGPCRRRLQPCNGYDLDYTQPMVEKVAQGFTNDVNANQTPANFPIVNDIRPSSPVEAHKAAIGDPITSLRSLVKRFMIQDRVRPGNCGINGWANVLAIQPFKLLAAQDSNRTTPSDWVSPDYIDLVSSMFRFRNGGMRLAVYGIDYDDAHNVIVGHHNIDDLTQDNTTEIWTRKVTKETVRPTGNSLVEMNQVVSTDEALTSPLYSVLPHYQTIQGVLQVEVPYYHDRALIRNSYDRYPLKDDHNPPDNFKWFNDDPNVATKNIVTITRMYTQNNPGESVWTIFRAAADDFNCGFLMGPPPTRDITPGYLV